MQVPAAGFIEIAKDQLRDLHVDQMRKQAEELQQALPDSSAAMVYGYQLGLQTARVLIETNAYLSIKGVKAEDVL